MIQISKGHSSRPGEVEVTVFIVLLFKVLGGAERKREVREKLESEA